MGWILRKSDDRTNPTLPGGVWGRYITAGRGTYWKFDGTRVRFLIIISDGGKYGMNTPTSVEYGGAILPTTDYKFHPGTYTKQITPLTVSSIDIGTNIVTATAHGLANGDPVRFYENIPGGVTDAKRYVYDVTANTFKLSSTADPNDPTPVDITSSPASPKFYSAAGWDDPIQGRPTYFTEIETTFSGICYVEGLLPVAFNESVEPTWENFRVIGVGRKLMNYDNAGTELGVTTDIDLCSNPALVDADCILNEMKRPSSRIDWTSWGLLKTDAAININQYPSADKSGDGLTGSYYSYTVAAPPTLGDGTLIVKRKDTSLTFSYVSGPGNSVPATKWIAIFEGQIKPKYTETYTFNVSHNDGAKLVINSTTIFNDWTDGPHASSGTVALTANTLYTFRLEFYSESGIASLDTKWSSASQALEVIPQNSMYEPAAVIKRYSFNGAYAVAIEASIVHEDIITRCPGWDWTDRDGKIIYLSPNRPSTYEFVYDKMDDSVPATIMQRGFDKARKHRRQRANFVLYSYRNQLLTGYPENFVEENRPRLRELGGGIPNNDEPVPLMVMHRSLAERIAALDMLLNADAPYNLEVDGRKPSSVITKADLVTVKNFVHDDRRIEDSICLVQSISKKGPSLNFTLTPIVEIPFYPADVEV